MVPVDLGVGVDRKVVREQRAREQPGRFFFGKDLGRPSRGGAVHALAGPVPAPFLSSFLRIGQVDEALAGKKRRPDKRDGPFDSGLGPRRRLHPVGGMRSKG